MNAWLFVLLFSVFHSAFASLPDLESLIANKDYAKAIKLGESLKQQNPKSASVLFYTALAYQHNKQPEQAKKLYLNAIQHNATLPEIYNNLASIYVNEKNYLKAAETLTLAINSDKSIATAYANLSQIYRLLASQAYQQVLDEDSRKKHSMPRLRTQLLVSLNYQETLNPLKPVLQTPIVVEVSPPPSITPIQQIAKKPSAQQAIIKWASAWQAKQYQSYVDSYSKTYAPKNLTRDKWMTQRKKRIQRPGDLFITVSNFDIKLAKAKAYVNFDQHYRSKTYQDKVRKRMHLTLIDGQWLITSEVTLSVL